MGEYSFKHFIRVLLEKSDIELNATIGLYDFLESMREYLYYNHSFVLDSKYDDVNDKISAILRLFESILYNRGSIQVTFNKIVILLRNSNERALRTPWSREQIQEVFSLIYVGLQNCDVSSDTDEEKDSDVDSAFSSDDD